MEFLREAFSGENRFVLRLAIIALGGFLFGYDTGVISGALLYIEADFHPSSFEAQAFVGALLVGAVLGAILSGFSADALSRRRTKIISGSVYVISAIGSTAAQNPEQLIFPLKVRSATMSVSTVANWASNFLVATFFLTLTGAITIQGTFWLYAGFGVLAVIFFAFRLPETKDRSLEEISHEVSEVD